MPPTPLRPPSTRRHSGSSRTLTILTLALGIGAAMAVLGFTEAALSGPLACPAPLSCSATAALDHLPAATSDRAPAEAAITSGFRTLVRLTLALAVVLIAMVGLNVATAALTGAAALRGDTALRAAIGASPLRLLTERIAAAARVALPAAVLGCALGFFGHLLLQNAWPGDTPPWEGPARLADGFLVAAAALTGILFAALCWPAALSWSRNLRSHLRGSGPATPGPADTLVRDVLAVVQAGASLTLMVTAGLLVFAFVGRSSDPVAAAADADRSTLLFELELPAAESGPGAMAARAHQYSALLERVRGLAGVVDTSLASEGAWLGLGVRERVTSLCMECWLGLLPKIQTTGPARIHFVGPGYFNLVGTEILRGRGLVAADDFKAEPVAVISETLAHRFFPNGDPLGKEIRLGRLDGAWFRVVGVVEDLEVEGLGTGSLPEPALYLSLLQSPPAVATLLTRTGDDPASLALAMEWRAGSLLPVGRMTPRGMLTEAWQVYRAPLGWFGWVFAALAVAAMVCACAGLYGLISAQVRLRTREIGIRMALGAGDRRILRMVTGRVLRLVALGSVVGVIPLGGLARLLQLRFQGVDPWDPSLVLSSGALLIAVALIAGIRPAWHAARVDPVVALREEVE